MNRISICRLRAQHCHIHFGEYNTFSYFQAKETENVSTAKRNFLQVSRDKGLGTLYIRKCFFFL